MEGIKVIIGLVVIGLACGCQRQFSGDLLIENVNIVDVKSGEILHGQDILIKNDTIAHIAANLTEPFDAPIRVNGSEKYIIPGLWDMHAHWIDAYEYFFPMLLANGVVGIRDMWGNLPVLKDVRKQISEGKIIGPEIVSAGFLVDGYPPYNSGATSSDAAE